MDFNKIILGENELEDFENLLIREKIVDSVQEDVKALVNNNQGIYRTKWLLLTR